MEKQRRESLIVVVVLAWTALGFLAGWSARCENERIEPQVFDHKYVGAERVCVIGRWP